VKRQIEAQKREFGVAVFDHLRAGEQEVVQQFLQQFQASVSKLEEQVAAKEEEIETLRHEISSINQAPPAYE